MRLFAWIFLTAILLQPFSDGNPITKPLPAANALQAPLVSKVLLPVRGMYVSFERRGSPSMYYTGETIYNFNNYDPVVGHTVAEEVSLQLDLMKQMGVNTITYELRTSDPTSAPFVYPTCNINPPLGFQYPQPTSIEVTNLVSFFDMVQSKGMKVFLRLVNTHMEEQPPTNNLTWLSAILNAIKTHPALDLVLFEGSPHWVDLDGDNLDDACGVQAEPPLWMGRTDPTFTYIKWAISYAHSIGMPYRKLSAQAIVGDFYLYQQGPAGPRATDSHLWDPVSVLKAIFDDLLIPNDQRTYAISFYEHEKCITARTLPCTNINPHAWAIETVTNLFDTIGRGNGARVDAVEMGLSTPIEASWNTEQTFESLVWIMQNYGIEGGCFYHWVSFIQSEDFDSTFASPILRRGADFTFNPVKNFLENLYTLGQTDDLNLTPDTNPPAFTSASTTPTLVKNGDTFQISANLGETHLFVTADLSALDSSRKDSVVLIDQGDGTYLANVTLQLWNGASNGVNSLSMHAMDFWSNVASTLVNISLQNPAPILDNVPPNDQFVGTTLNQDKWQDISTNGGTTAQNDQLILTTGGTQTTSFAGVQSTWGFTGDFDMQVEFQIGDGWSIPATGHIDGAIFGVQIAGQIYHVTRLRRDNGDNVVFAWSSTGSLSGETTASAIAGRYRLIRKGTELTLLFDIGSGWVEIAHTTVPSTNANVYLENTSIDASHTFTAYFSNFQINSGLTTYLLKTFLPMIKR